MQLTHFQIPCRTWNIYFTRNPARHRYWQWYVHSFSISMDPTVRHTWWSLTFGGFFTYLSLYGTNQVQVQRMLTIKWVWGLSARRCVRGPAISRITHVHRHSIIKRPRWRASKCEKFHPDGDVANLCNFNVASTKVYSVYFNLVNKFLYSNFVLR